MVSVNFKTTRTVTHFRNPASKKKDLILVLVFYVYSVSTNKCVGAKESRAPGAAQPRGWDKDGSSARTHVS